MHSALTSAQAPTYGAIVVRGDIYADWTLAMALSMKERVPVLTLFEENQEEIIRVLRSLSGGRRSVLIVGDSMAVSKEFEIILKSMGIDVDRVGGATRADTSLQMIIRGFWTDSTELIVVDGQRRELYLPALSISSSSQAPIIYSVKGKLPENFFKVVDNYLKELKVIYVLNSSISSEEISKLTEMGYSVKELNFTSLTTPRESSLKKAISWFGETALWILFGAFIGGIFSYLLILRKRMKLDILMDFLTRDEKKLVSMIIERGEIRQEELPELTGFSRPKISRMVNELVSRGILEKEVSGKTYLLRVRNLFK